MVRTMKAHKITTKILKLPNHVKNIRSEVLGNMTQIDHKT